MVKNSGFRFSAIQRPLAVQTSDPFLNHLCTLSFTYKNRSCNRSPTPIFATHAFIRGQISADFTNDERYDAPAKVWETTLPIGNGRLGAIIFGGLVEEHLQINENSLWSGSPYDPANPDALATSPEVRSFLFAENDKEAHGLVASTTMEKPQNQAQYQPVGSPALIPEFTQ